MMWPFACLSPILLGGAMSSVLIKRKPFDLISSVFAGSIGIGIGLGLTSAATMTWLFAIGPPGIQYYVLEFCLSAFSFFFAMVHITSRRSAVASVTLLSPSAQLENALFKRLFYLLLMLALIWFFLQSYFLYPHGKGDAYAIWNLRARLLFRSGDNWINTFTVYPWSHPDYPLLVSGSVYRMWQVIHRDTIAVPIVIASLFTFGSVLLVYTSIAMLKGINRAYLSAFAILATFTYFQLGVAQTADIPLAFFITATLVLLIFKDNSQGNAAYLALLSGISASCAAWTKNEGLLFIAVILVTRFCIPWHHRSRRSHLREIIYFILGAAPIMSLLVYFKLQIAPANDVINIDTLKTLPGYLLDLSRYKMTAAALVKEIALFGNGILVFFIVYFWIVRKDESLEVNPAPTALTLLLMVWGYAAVFLLTPHNLAWHLKTFDRLLLHLWPAAVLIFFLVAADPTQRNNMTKKPRSENINETPQSRRS